MYIKKKFFLIIKKDRIKKINDFRSETKKSFINFSFPLKKIDKKPKVPEMNIMITLSIALSTHYEILEHLLRAFC